MTIQNTSPLPQPDYLETELREPQPTGIAKLINIINGFLDGGIQGDEMGLGKTIQAIVTAIENRPNVKGCFDLIVTTKATIAQWEEELQQHFKPVCL
jgi:SNF2 family DNA or RNA helicase